VRVFGFPVIAAGVAFFGLATLLVIDFGLGALATGCVGFVSGLSLILQAKGKMD
jgi:hypothetical protein